MEIYNYYARDAKGEKIDGTIEALNEMDAANRLQKQGLFVVSIKIAKQMEDKEIPNMPGEKEKQLGIRKCPYCAEEIKKEAILCRFCGKKIGKTIKVKDIKSKFSYSLIISAIVILVIVVSNFILKPERGYIAKGKEYDKKGMMNKNIGNVVVDKKNIEQINIKQEDKVQKEDAEKAPSTISGHIYITVGSGESLMARGVEVYLIPETTEFDERSQKLDKIRNGIASHINNVITERNSSNVNYNDDFIKKAYNEINSLSEARRLSREYITKSFIFYSGSASELTKASFEAEYKFEKINPSDYYIYVKYKTNFNEGYWFVPITVKANTVITLDLNNSNFFDEESAFQRRTMADLKEKAVNHIEELLRIMGIGESSVLETELQIEKAWIDSENQPIDTGRFQYPEPVKELDSKTQ